MATVITFLMLGIGAGLFFRPEEFVKWAGATLILYGILRLFKDRRSARIGSFTAAKVKSSTAFCALILFILCAYAGWSLLTGDRPVGSDNTYHFFRTWFLRYHLLPAGKVYGWNNLIMAGTPVGYHYPFLGHFWAAATSYLSGDLISIEMAYSWVVWLTFFFGVWAVYYVGKEWFGSVVGLVAGLLCFLDLGTHPIGGRLMLIHVGVWPVLLSVSIAFISLLPLMRIMKGERSGASASGLALLLGFAIMHHPLQLINVFLMFIIAVLSWILSERIRSFPWIRLVMIMMLGIGFAGWWLIPFFDASAYSAVPLKAGYSDIDLGRSLLQGTIFEETSAVISIIGIVASFCFVFSKSLIKRFCGLSVILLFPLQSDDVVSAVLGHFPFLAESLEPLRFAVFLKPFLYLAAACGLCFLWKELKGRGLSIQSCNFFIQDWRRRLLLCIILSPFLTILLMGAGHFIRHDSIVESKRAYKEDRSQIAEYLKSVSSESVWAGRLAVQRGPGWHHSLADYGIEAGYGIYEIDWTPSRHFVYGMRKGEEVSLNAAGVRFLVCEHSYPAPHSFRLVKSYKELRLYENSNWKMEPFRLLSGTGEVTLLSFNELGELKFFVEEGAAGRLLLQVPFYPGWQGYRNGEEIEIRPARIRRVPVVRFMEIDLLPGNYEFSMHAARSETVGKYVTLGSLLCILILLFGVRSEVAGPCADYLLQHKKDIIWSGLIVLSLTGAGLVYSYRIALYDLFFKAPWKLEYTDLKTGELRVLRAGRASHKWGAAAPAAGLARDHFRLIYESCLMIPEDLSAEFLLSSDDSAEIFLNDESVLKSYYSRLGENVSGSGDIKLKSGNHRLKVVFEENTFDALLNLKIAYNGGPPGLIPMEWLSYPDKCITVGSESFK